LSDAELGTEVDPPWTAAGLLAHIAFWDRFVLERWNAAAARGERLPASVDDDVLDLVNDAALPGWNAARPRAAVEECVAATTTFDRFAESVAEDVRDEVAAGDRPRLLDRSLHREEHLRTLEAAFPDA
jgi:hypothetical protein